MLILIILGLMDLMLMDYQSHIVVIHISIFGLMLVVVVKKIPSYTTVMALILMHLYLHMLVVATTVNQLLGIAVIITHTSSTTLYGMEQNVQIISVMMLLNVGSIVS